jgi:hypothetical protein
LWSVRALGKQDHGAKTEAAVHRGLGKRPEDDHLGAEHQQPAPRHRPLARTGRFVLQRVRTGAALDEAVDGPAGPSEEPPFLGDWSFFLADA